MKAEGRTHNQNILIPNTGSDDRGNEKGNGNNHNYKAMSIEGVKVHYTQEAMDQHGPRMTKFLKDSLTEIERLVPSDAWNVMKTVEIYVNNEY